MLSVITGPAGAGKNTVADILTEHFGFKQLAFADPLKFAASWIFDMPIENFYDQDLKEKVSAYWGMSPRGLLQKLGTDACREVFGPDIWIKAMQSKMLRLIDQGYDIVITDGRFDNEADTIRNLGGKVIHIQTNRPSTLANGHQAHKSESGVKFIDGDFVIDNNGTLAELEEIVRFFVAEERQDA